MRMSRGSYASRGCPSLGHAQLSELQALCETLQAQPEIEAKKAIRHSAVSYEGLSLEQRYALPGDDCAAFSCGNGYQLLAMEGMLPQFVRTDPRAAGWSAVMVNVNDIAAMGGRAQAITNAYWHHSDEQSAQLIFHIKRACKVFGVHFAGGHSSIQADYAPHLAVAITGYAQRLLSCHHLRAGQRLFLLSDLSGSWHGDLPYWGCVQGKTEEQIRQQWQLPAVLAEEGLAVAAKDISNGGLFGTLIMMLELSGCGAKVDLSAIPRPAGDFVRWLRAFQSFGFLLAVEPDRVSQLIKFFNHSHLRCAPIGTIDDSAKIDLDMAGNTTTFWDLKKQPLTNMGAKHAGSTL